MTAVPLDPWDIRLIRCLQDNPRSPYVVIGRLMDVSETTVRRRIESMTSSRLITLAAVPDLYRLGYVSSAYVGVKTDVSRLFEVAEAIGALPDVTFVALTTGRFDLIFSSAQRSVQTLTRFLVESIAPIPGIRDLETFVVPQLVKGFSKDWRIPIEGESPPESMPNIRVAARSTGETTRPVDAMDLRLIRLLQADPRAAYATIARQADVSETTVRRRVEALISSGAISISVVPDLKRLGYVSSAFIGLKIDLSRLDDVVAAITPIPEVTFVAVTTGRFDLLIYAAERTLDDLTRFVVSRVASIPGVVDTETLVSPRLLKVLSDWRLPDPLAESSASTSAMSRPREHAAGA